jgi:CPA2 family monovalent cation:H+ antiporter-2
MVLSMLATPFILAKSDAIVMRFSANEWMMQSLALTTHWPPAPWACRST